ncbi:MAG: hypothetical protein JST92_13030, partial [Deltaproteobacteria bacterium]|nr:hypothetical protein [Deltaproteobacteria bacterium]
MKAWLVIAALCALASSARAENDTDKVKQHADAAMGELDKGKDAAEPGMPEQDPATALSPEGQQVGGIEQLGNARESGRDASETMSEAPPPAVSTCPEGFVPLMEKGQQVIGLDGKPACKLKRAFVKGELTNLGATKLKLKDSRFGLRLGYARLDGSSYLSVDPEVDMAFGKFSFGLGLPLHIRAYANGFVDGGGINFRKHDYDQASDYAKIIRFITYGNKEDNIYLNIS